MKPKFYFKYVDDTVLCIEKQEFDHVFKFFNEYERNLTNEIESNEKINFLDVTAYRTNNVIFTNWYQKSIVSDRVLLCKAHKNLSLKIINLE